MISISRSRLNKSVKGEIITSNINKPTSRVGRGKGGGRAGSGSEYGELHHGYYLREKVRSMGFESTTQKICVQTRNFMLQGDSHLHTRTFQLSSKAEKREAFFVRDLLTPK